MTGYRRRHGSEGMDTLDAGIADLRYAPEEVVEKNARLRERLLSDSSAMEDANFTAISTVDLERLFELYDNAFFSGCIQRILRIRRVEVCFRLSGRMTRAAGKTTRIQERRSTGVNRAGRKRERYEIAVSGVLLLGNFRDGKTVVTVNGIPCESRLDALQRVFEHELVHLVEMLVWGNSRCSKTRFKQLAWNLFGHSAAKHALLRPGQTAVDEHHGLCVGDRVSFLYKRKRYVGVVNRITKRATVLVESSKGVLYSDGKRYVKYYVPPSMLSKV